MSGIETKPDSNQDGREVITLTEASVGETCGRTHVTAILSFSRGGTYKIGFEAPSTEFLERLNDSFLHKGTSTVELSKMAVELFDNNLRSVFPQGDSIQATSENIEQTHQLRTDWDRALRGSMGNLELIIEGGSTIHSVPWEFVVTQPDGRLSPRVPVVRKLTGYAPPPGSHTDRPPRVLLVIARPYGPLDVSHRYIAHDLLLSTRQKLANVTIDVLRGGGSFERLAVRLEESDYQIVHFDMHGEIFDGQGHLRFESDEVEGSDDYKLVNAKAVAELLLDNAVQLGIFTACDSARPWSGAAGVNESLAHEMARLGVPATIGMSQPVSAKGAKQFSRHLYEELFNENRSSVAVAVARAKAEFRRTLLAEKSDRSEEWRIPTLYLRSDPDLSVQYASTGEPPERADHSSYEQLHDRDFDHRLIDRLLFQRNDPILVRGLRHTGKRALLSDLQLWWTSANYARHHLSVDCGENASIEAFLAELKQLKHLSGDSAASDVATVNASASTDEPLDIKALRSDIFDAAKERVDWKHDQVNHEFGAIFYLKRVDQIPERYRDLMRMILEVAQHPAVHAVLSAPSVPDWLSQSRFQTFDMLWLSSQPARDLFVSEAGHADDILISACSDLPGLVKEISRNPRVRDRKLTSHASHYFDDVLPSDNQLNEELSPYGLTVAHLLPFGGLKGFPLPLVERQLLRRYLHICLKCRYLEVLNTPRKPGDQSPRESDQFSAVGSKAIMNALEKLGYLTPMPDPRVQGDRNVVARDLMRIHPYLPLVARRKLRSALKLDTSQMAKANVTDLQRLQMGPLKNAYDEMRLWRNREFEMLRSRRRVELWYLDRSPISPIEHTKPEAEETRPKRRWFSSTSSLALLRWIGIRTRT